MASPGRFGDRRCLRVGLLGGSFNPAHDGHRAVARGLLRALRLDQVWLLVSPGNPLKSSADMAPLAARLASATRIADGRAIVATAIEADLGTLFSVNTVRALRRRFPRMAFVWLMGADAWAELPRWRRWSDLVGLVPIAVHARPGQDRRALGGQASHRLQQRRIQACRAASLPHQTPPAWAFLHLPHQSQSATALRLAGLGLNSACARPPAKD